MPLWHIPARVRIVWAIRRENPSTGLTCRWVHEKRYKSIKNSLYFTHLPRSPPWTDLHQICHSRRGRQCNHYKQIFWWSVKGCGFCGGQNLPVIRRLAIFAATADTDIFILIAEAWPATEVDALCGWLRARPMGPLQRLGRNFAICF